MITVKEIMTTELVTLKQTDNLETARTIMYERGIRHIPLIDDDTKLVGLVTQRDVLRASTSTLEGDKHLIDESQISLGDIMTGNVSFAHPKDSLRVAGIELQKEKYGCLPVVENDKLVGIITDTDFVGVAIDLIEHMDFAEDSEF